MKLFSVIAIAPFSGRTLIPSPRYTYEQENGARI
jgi:hypothetical protein